MPPRAAVAAPQTVGKGNMKAKGKGKGKAKGKAKAKALAAKVAARAAAAEAAAVEGADGEVVEEEKQERLKTGPSAARKKVLQDLGEKTLEEAMAEQRCILQRADAVVAEADALSKAHAEQIAKAEAEYAEARAKVTAATDQEVDAAKHFRVAKVKKDGTVTRTGEARTKLMEAERKVAMLEVMYANAVKMKELEDRRREATQAAELAKQNLALTKQREKAALEATRAALEAARQKAKDLGRGMATKRPTPEAAGGEQAAKAQAAPAATPDAETAAAGEPPKKLPTVREGDDIE